MKIAVLSDTHVSSVKGLPKKMLDLLSRVDFIIHAGDFTSTEVLNELKQIGEVKAVHGNMDSAELKAMLPAKEIIDTGNKEKRVRNIFVQDKVDAIVYGHSHGSQNKVIDGILFFNPGKASDSFGIITIEEDIKGKIISSVR